jgi:hypothetical protein
MHISALSIFASLLLHSLPLTGFDNVTSPHKPMPEEQPYETVMLEDPLLS